MFSTISVLLALCFTAQAIRRDSVWTIRLTPTDADANQYEGPVEVLAAFTDGKQHSVTLPNTKYEKGRVATFRVGLVSPGPLQMAYIRTHGVCAIGLLPLNVLRLRQVELVSEDTNTTYNKFVEDLAIKDACQSNKSLGTAIKDFDEFNPAYCLVDGKKYADGEQFDMGCAARCTCVQGLFGCVDMCPTVSWSPERKCRFVRLPGQCCDAVRCEDDDAMKSCDAPVPKYDTDDNRRTGTVRRYPWAVLLCSDAKCSQAFGGIIVGSRHVLTYATDLSTFPDLRLIAGQYIAPSVNGTSDFSPLRVAKVIAHPDFVNGDSPIADSASRLQLLQLDQPFTFDTQIQSVNLPFNKEQCAALSKEHCPLMTVGWDVTDEQDADVQIRQWFLHSEKSSPEESACTNGTRPNPKMVLPRRRGEKRVCLSGLARNDCTGPMGGAVLSTRGAVDFLVGLLDPDSALFACENQGTASLLPICKYADWITATMTAGNF